MCDETVFACQASRLFYFRAGPSRRAERCRPQSRPQPRHGRARRSHKKKILPGRCTKKHEMHDCVGGARVARGHRCTAATHCFNAPRAQRQRNIHPQYRGGRVARARGGIHLHSLLYVPRRSEAGSSDGRSKNSRHLCRRARLAPLAACAWQADQDSGLATHRSKTPHRVQAHASHRQGRPTRTRLQPSPHVPSRRRTETDNIRPIAPSRIGTGSNDIDRSLDN